MKLLKAKQLGSNKFMIAGPILVVIVLALFFLKVDTEPKITPDFFFSSDSKIYQQDQKIQEKFPFQQQILLNVTTNQIYDPNYIEKIGTLSDRILKVKGIDSVHSMTHGPENLEDARENPLWRRLLIGEDEKSTFVIAMIGTDDYQDLVHKIEKIVKQEENKWFEIRISGLPYIVEQIRRNLSTDMKRFTFGAVLLSAFVLFSVFRSVLLVVGALVTCITAAMLTLVIQSFMGIPIGILTANLGTIVFVLAQTHIIFLVANWCNAATDSKETKFRETMRHTFPASFWSAVTTTLGFASLIFVEAKPLNQLGVGGTVGTFCALACAYTIFPAFLKLSKIEPSSFTYALARKFPLRKQLALTITLFTLILTGILGLGGIPKINTDPSLLSYFKEDTKLYKGIFHVDENGGSNPLNIVVRRADGMPLDSGDSYDRMWKLQQDLNGHDSVGSVISLPVIMAEGDEHWLGSLLPWNVLLDILSKPEFGAIAKSFVNEDRTEALFMLRMKESGRERDRLEIIQEIEKIPAKHGFTLTMTGGTYYLQGELAASVAQSMTYGIVTLIVLFGVIAVFLAGSLIVAAAIVICASAIAAIVLGTLGAFSVPVDIISSPSVNICLGLIVDDMIHLTVTARRHAKEMKAKSLQQWDVLKEALNGQSWPALVSTITIMIGFSVFSLSDFPPSQRFGLEIVYGAGLAVILALVVFPYLASFRNKRSEES